MVLKVAGLISHYHAIYYDLPEDPYLVQLLFDTIWAKGFTHPQPVISEGAAGYVAKYLVNDESTKDCWSDPFLSRPFSVMSKGLGLDYIDRMKDYHLADPDHRLQFQFHGDKSALCRYYRNKIFPEGFFKDKLDREGSELDRQVRAWAELRDRDPKGYESLQHDFIKFMDDTKYASRWKCLTKHTIK